MRRDVETSGANPIAHPGDVIRGADLALSHCCPGGGTAPATAAQALSSSEDAQASGSTRDVVQYARDGGDSADGSTEQGLADAGGSAPGGEVDKSAWDVWRSVVQAAKQQMSPSRPPLAGPPEAAKQQTPPPLPAPAGLPVSSPATVELEHPIVCCSSCAALDAWNNIQPVCMQEGRVASAQCRPRGMERQLRSGHGPAAVLSPVAPGTALALHPEQAPSRHRPFGDLMKHQEKHSASRKLHDGQEGVAVGSGAVQRQEAPQHQAHERRGRTLLSPHKRRQAGQPPGAARPVALQAGQLLLRCRGVAQDCTGLPTLHSVTDRPRRSRPVAILLGMGWRAPVPWVLVSTRSRRVQRV